MSDTVLQLPVEQMVPSPLQPRVKFDEASLEELAESIRRHGVVQPLLVRRVAAGYEVIAGERRLRAARLAGLRTVPAIVRPCNDRDALEIALIENLQREEIGPLEAARAFQRLAREFGYSHERIAERTGKSRTTVANVMRLLQLAPAVQRSLEEDQISEGHARALLAIVDLEIQADLCAYAIRNALSVRELERKARGWQRPRPGPKAPSPAQANPILSDLEDRLRHHFGTQVRIQYRAGRGALTLDFYSDDDLDRLLDLLGVLERRSG